MERNLIDEYRILIHPVLLCKGGTFFREGTKQVNLKPADTAVKASGQIASKAVWLGDDVEALDDAAAMEKAAAEFKVPINRRCGDDPPQGLQGTDPLSLFIISHSQPGYETKP